jgi:spore maturation protein CgeB
MGDGVDSDTEMWRTGERDLEILLRGLPEPTDSLTAVDLACGVGRLMKAAASRFQRVIGVDVSEEALSSAKQLLNVADEDLILSDGESLGGIETGSIDLVYSFASLGCIPVETLARYLTEISRVLKVGARARLQLYLGSENLPFAEDTLSVRCYQRERFLRASALAGLVEEQIFEVELPFEVSDRSSDITAMVVCLRKEGESTAGLQEILAELISQPEPRAGADWGGSPTEYEMAIARVEQLLEQGEIDLARKCLEYAVSTVKQVEPEILELLEKLRGTQFVAGGTGNGPAVRPVQAQIAPSLELLSSNLSNYPELQSRLEGITFGAAAIVRNSTDEIILSWDGLPLDNFDKPKRSAEAWTERTLASPRVSSSEELVVFGAGSGYHLDELARRYTGKLHLIEPNLAVLKTLLSGRDMRGTFARFSTISTDFRAEYCNAELVIHPQSQIISRRELDELKSRLYAKRGRTELRPSIGVLGPLYGGTLPVTYSVMRSLLGMNQRVRCFDMSSFHQSFVGIEGFVRDRTRRDLLQNQYIETLSQIVLESVTEKPIDILICLAQAPITPRVLTELRSRGVITVMWFVEDCKRFTAWQHISRYFDYMFVIQRGEIQRMVEQAGAGRAIYLPVACDPYIHRPLAPEEIEEPKRWGSDLSFVGAGYNNRQQMFASLSHRNLKIWGTEWPTVSPFDRLVQERGRRIAPEEYVKIFNSSTINLNLHSSSERDGVEPFGDFVNPRTFELAACGAFQLVDNRTLLPELFDVGRELATFSNLRELEEQIDFYLANPALRREMASAARERALREHTYEHRLEQMLGYIYADRFEELKGREAASPWKRTLAAAKEFPDLHERLLCVYDRGEDPKIQPMIADIQSQKGKLSEGEMKLLFLWHVRQSVVAMNDSRAGRSG